MARSGPALPTQSQLFLPLLHVLREHGPLSASDACDAVAEKVGLSDEARMAFGEMADGQKVNLFDRRVRWTRQNAVLGEMIDPSVRGLWRLTEEGSKTDQIAKPGIVITVFATTDGSLVWSEAKSALRYIEDGAVTSVITSPPYPLVRPREYDVGMVEWQGENYLTTLLDHIEAIRPKLSADGTFVLNLGPAFLPSSECRNPYQHRLIATLVDRLGWHLVDEHIWVSPTKPRAAPQVTKTRTHCCNSVEQIFLLSSSGRTKCSNTRVLAPHTDRHRTLLASGGERVQRTSPSKIRTPGARYTRDAGGSIPCNVHTHAPDRDLAYRRFCAEHGLAAHPAMMPLKLAEFFVQLTSEPGDLIFDPFGGSGKVAEAAWNLDRRFIITERRLDYLRGAMSRTSLPRATRP